MHVRNRHPIRKLPLRKPHFSTQRSPAEAKRGSETSFAPERSVITSRSEARQRDFLRPGAQRYNEVILPNFSLHF
ncbi:uncharacterized protein CPUR_03825 [Claviceps purpurea 20.1]|uniref:Uncharacterized protein n=1 Tax=Claviceps purpurea (strain 20.1) TaxID=1111077 RepID=M1W9R0_CLAP2|nr:uncharacterized protein CPUR_03825 [Claviceps purpurea 20.1]